MSNKFIQSREFQYGADGEEFVANVLKKKGHGVIHSHNRGTEGVAPYLSFFSRNIIAPDLFYTEPHNPKLRALEVKRMAQATYTRKTGRLEVGMKRYYIDNYLDFQQLTGMPVWVAFIIDDRKEVRLANINFLSTNYRSSLSKGQNSKYRDYVFWEVFKLPLWLTNVII